MKNKEKAIFICLAMFATICIGAIGIAIAERSILVATLSILGIIISMGVGFTLKKKFREVADN